MKNCEKILTKKKKLSNFKVFVNDNLTAMNETIAYKCGKLKRSGFISNFYSRNGIVHIEEEKRSTPITVSHMDNLFITRKSFKNNDKNDDQYLQSY